MKEDSEATNP